jgi:hypothetical protein
VVAEVAAGQLSEGWQGMVLGELEIAQLPLQVKVQVIMAAGVAVEPQALAVEVVKVALL